MKGLAAVKKCKYVYLEGYTAILPGLDREQLAAAYGIPEVLEADRELVESGCAEMLERALEDDVAFMVVGDPFCATTHSDLWLRAQKQGVHVRVVHNASVMNAVAACGLQLYQFGETVSICYWTDTWRPDSYYDKILANSRAGWHTLCLLDIKTKEQSIENLLKGRKIYEPPRFMSVKQALEQLMEIEEAKGGGIFTPDSEVIGIARLGHEDQKIVFGACKDVVKMDLGDPLHSLVLPKPELHEMEREVVEMFREPGLLERGSESLAGEVVEMGSES